MVHVDAQQPEQSLALVGIAMPHAFDCLDSNLVGASGGDDHVARDVTQVQRGIGPDLVSLGDALGLLGSLAGFLKPFEPAELLANLASLLQLSERSETGIRTETAGTGI